MADDGAGFSIADADDAAEGDAAPEAGSPKKPSRRDRLAGILDGVALWRSPNGIAHASVPFGDHQEHMRVVGRDFRTWLMVRFYEQHDAGLSGTALAETVALAEARALSSGAVRTPARRWALHRGRIYHDLGGGDPQGQRGAVEIGDAGWRILRPEDVPVPFLRAPDAAALPEPERDDAKPGDLCAFVNVGNEESLALIWAWLVCAARPFETGGSYPILLLHGEQGSGKTGASRALQAVLDPSTMTGRSLPREQSDLYITASNRHVLAFDNVSNIGDGVADDFCRVSTGGGFSARALHTDADEVVFTAVKPVLFNGIPSTILGRPDLADRALSVELLPLRQRREEAELAAEFAQRRPGLLGLLYDGLSAALRNLPATKLQNPPRMIDAATWAEAAAPGLGIEPGRIAAAWLANRSGADRAALDVDDVAQAVLRLIDQVERMDILGDEVAQDPRAGRRYWRGSPQALYGRLSEIVGERVSRGRLWPQNPSGMGTKLRRIAPGLRAVHGIEVTSGKSGADGARWWHVRRV